MACTALVDEGGYVRRQSEMNVVTGATSRDDNGNDMWMSMESGILTEPRKCLYTPRDQGLDGKLPRSMESVHFGIG